MEEWRYIFWAPKYQASSFGRIKGVYSNNAILKLTPNHAGYLVVALNGIQYRVNRIICEVFNGSAPKDKPIAAHKDGIKRNNYAINLYWATHQENSNDMKNHNTQVKGSKVGIAKLTEADVIDIKARLARGESPTYIRDNIYSYVSYGVISHIKNGRTWRHI